VKAVSKRKTPPVSAGLDKRFYVYNRCFEQKAVLSYEEDP
jgi:hypothetical protein